MIRYLSITLLLFFAFASAWNVVAQVSSTLTGIGIDAKVIAPITLENNGNTPLDFGTVSRSSTAGTVTVPTTGDRIPDGGVGVLGSSSFSPAPFTVTGENSSAFNVTLPANGTVVLTRVSGAETMAVNGFTSNAPSSLSSSGSASFTIGATLSVGANQMAGEYTGSFAVTVAYQ